MPNKKRRCRCCKKYSVVDDGLIINTGYYCDHDCAVRYSIANKHKGAKIKHTAQKKVFNDNDIKLRKKAAKIACHAFIRERDKNDNCICCGRALGAKFDAGHFLESGNNSFLRYHEDNIHAQSVYCNQYKGGDSDDYEGRLRKKIGNKRVDYLLNNKGGVVKRTAQDYKKIELYYKKKLADHLLL